MSKATNPNKPKIMSSRPSTNLSSSIQTYKSTCILIPRHRAIKTKTKPTKAHYPPMNNIINKYHHCSWFSDFKGVMQNQDLNCRDTGFCTAFLPAMRCLPHSPHPAAPGPRATRAALCRTGSHRVVPRCWRCHSTRPGDATCDLEQQSWCHPYPVGETETPGGSSASNCLRKLGWFFMMLNEANIWGRVVASPKDFRNIYIYIYKHIYIYIYTIYTRWSGPK